MSQSDPTTPSTDPTTAASAAQPTAPKPAAAKQATASAAKVTKKAAGSAAKATKKATGSAATSAKKAAAPPAAEKATKKGAAKKTAPEPEAAAPVPTRSPEEIQADIDAAQQRLADTVDALSDRLTPASLAEDATSSVKGVFVDRDGRIKPKPIAIIGGTVAGLVLLRAIFHRD